MLQVGGRGLVVEVVVVVVVVVVVMNVTSCIASGSSCSFAVCGGQLYGWGAVTHKSRSGGSTTVLVGEEVGALQLKPMAMMKGE